jgi:hypothetical protein
LQTLADRYRGTALIDTTQPAASVARRAWPAATFAATALIVTWPLALHIGSHLPLGQLHSTTVPLFNLWTLEWNADRLMHGYAGYWDAPIFYPVRGAFAFSEPQAATGVVFAALQAVCGSIAAYNLTLITWLTLNGVAAQRLLGLAGTSRLAAWAGGVLAVALPFSLKELGVLQLTALFPPIFALAELCVLLRAPAWRPVLRLGVWLALTLWTCIYYALFLSLFMALGLIVVLATARVRLWRAPLIGSGAIALSIAVIAAAPLATVQRGALAQRVRSDKSVHRGSAYAENYAMLPPNALGAHVEPWFSGGEGKRNLYPGSVLIALAVTGVVSERRGKRRRFVWLCASCALLAALLSFGTRFGVLGVRPYTWLERGWPGFAQLRSPYRFAAFAQVFVLALAGFGLERLARARWHVRGRPVAAWCVVLATVLLGMLEVTPFGGNLARFPLEALNESWVDWLRAQPDGAVAMVPPERSSAARDYEPIAVAMLQGLRHGHPIVNGYSGFFPPRSTALASALRRLPDPTSLAYLERFDVRYVVVDRAWLAAREAAAHARADGVQAAWPSEAFADAARVVYVIDAR